MSQHDYNLANAAGASIRSDINDALLAVVSQNSGAAEPATTFAYQLWADTTAGWLKQRNAANSAWIKRIPLGTAARVDVASAATLDLTASAANSDYLRITGTTTITAVTLEDGQKRYALAGGAFQLTNGASLVLPGAANYTCTAGDLLLFIGEASSVVRVEIIPNVSPGAALTGPSGSAFSLRNKIINGCCRVAQRGNVAASGGANTYGGCDRIFAQPNGGGVTPGTIQQVAASWAKSGYAQRLGAVSFASGAANYVTFGTRLEAKDVAALNGKTIMVSCKLNHDVGSGVVPTIALYKANSADNFGAVTQVGSTYTGSAVASATPTQVATTFTLGSSDSSNGLMVVVTFSGMGVISSKNFDIGDFMLVEGSNTSEPMEIRPIGLELALCQRYYYRKNFLTGQYIAALQAYSTTSAYGPFVSPPVPMRATPTSVGSSSMSGFSLGNSASTNAAVTTNFVLTASADGAILITQADRTGAGLVAGNVSVISPNTTGTYAYAECEL